MSNESPLASQGPSGIQELRWQCPPVGYLPQVKAAMLHDLISPENATTLGFYVYNPNIHKITLRTERVESASDGTFVVYSRPSPEAMQDVSYYDPQGRLVKRMLQNGRVLLPTTKDELAARWKIHP